MNSSQEPFPDQIDTSLFYGGGSRRDIVEQIKTALSEDVVLMTLTGTDGSGKTMVCRVVQQELSGNHEVVFFDQGVDSFDDVVNRIAVQVGLGESEESSDRKVRLEKTVELLSDSDRRFIIIIDSAEDIFLATLERIRRMLDEVNGERLCVQLIFSGGPLLSLNYKQLAIIDFETVEEKHFSLDPLDAEQTFDYLNHCLEKAGFPENDRFSRAQAEKIADLARGNFRLINQLGGRYFDEDREVDLDESELKELYHGVTMTGEDGAYEKISAGLKNVDLDFLKVPRLGTRWYLAGGGLIVLILLFLLLSGGEEEPEELPGSADVPELTLEKVEPDPIEIPEPSPAPAPVAETVPMEAPVKSAEDAPSPVEAVAVESKKVDDASVPAERRPVGEHDGLVTQEAEKVPDREERAVKSVQAAIAEKEPADTEPVAGAEKASADPEPAAVAEREPVDTEPVAVAKNEPADSEPPAGAEKEPVDTEPVTGAEKASADPEPVAGAEKEPADTEPVAVAEKASADPEPSAVAEKESADPDPAAVAEKASAETEPLKSEEEIEPAAEPTESVVSIPGNQEPESENSPTGAEASPAESMTALPREEEATAEQARPGAVSEGDENVAGNRSETSLQIPQLAVVPRQLPATESVPFEVITLNQASKIKPENIPAPPVSQTDEEEPAPEPEPRINQQSQQITGQGAGETSQPEAQPAETAPLRVAETTVPSQSVQSRSVPPRNPDTYYAERLAAGSRWLVGGSSQKYTVQLMVLNAEDAQENVREMLVEDDYQSIMDKLYILRKSGQPQTVMLYYGEFDTSAEARQAKAQLPPFLNRLDPYELAVKEAVAKARAGQ